jgi:hypothetical protein
VRVVAVVLAVGAAAAACANASPATSSTQLTIAVWAKGRDARADPKKWTLRCEPPGGTLPRPGRACSTLLLNRGALRPVPPGTACTQIYGGPQEALVTGTVRGKRVWARFNRRNGCEISRWSRLAPLFPVRV